MFHFSNSQTTHCSHTFLSHFNHQQSTLPSHPHFHHTHLRLQIEKEQAAFYGERPGSSARGPAAAASGGTTVHSGQAHRPPSSVTTSTKAWKQRNQNWETGGRGQQQAKTQGPSSSSRQAAGEVVAGEGVCVGGGCASAFASRCAACSDRVHQTASRQLSQTGASSSLWG